MLAKDKETYFKVLDGLRESGITNMFVFGAAPYLRKQFRELRTQEARMVTLEWMQTFSQRHSNHPLNRRHGNISRRQGNVNLSGSGHGTG